MMKRYYSFAGVDFCFAFPGENFCEDEGHLAAFRSEKYRDCHYYRFVSSETLDPPQGECIYNGNKLQVYRYAQGKICYVGNVAGRWKNANLRTDHRGREHVVQVNTRVYPEKISAKAVLSAVDIENLIAQAGGFILHASYIVWKGKGILFTAPSETGKSTQAELWRRFRDAQIVNGDRAVVRMTEGNASAWGLPFAGSSAYCENVTSPLLAIVYLEQAKETSIQRICGYNAFRRIWEGVSVNAWDAENLSLVSDTVTQVLNSVPVYHLSCTPDESAVSALERMLKE